MAGLLEELETQLATLASAHEEMLVYMAEKRNAIVDGNIAAMEETLQNEQRVLETIEKAEETRKRLVEQARIDLGIKGRPVKLAQIVAAAGEPAASRLKAVHERLKGAMDTLRYRSRQNAELLKASMEHVEQFLQLVREAAGGKQSVTYGPDGRKNKGSLKMLDRCA